MPEAIVKFDPLVVHVTAFERTPAGDNPAEEQLVIDLFVENPASTLGSTYRVPPVEARDGDGNAYELERESDAFAEPIRPAQEARGRLVFRVPVDATNLSLVVAPSTDEEASVELR